MIVKAFVITEKLKTGGEQVIAVRLSFTSAREIAKKKGGRKVTRFFATKDEELSENENYPPIE